MARATAKTIRRWVTWIVVLVFVLSLGVWFLRRDPLPTTVRIATGDKDGLYFRLGKALEPSLSEQTRRKVFIEATNGSVDNRRLLVEGTVDLAVVEGGSVRMDDISVVTPLFPELLLIVVRKDRQIETIADLVGRNVSLGRPGSGNRVTALRVLKHYGISESDLEQNELHFGRVLDEPLMDAAIVTAGIGHPDLSAVLRSNQFDLLPIADAEAVDTLHPFLRSTIVPRGLFAEHPSVPAENTPTIATTAYLVARNDASNKLINAALASVHERSLRLEIPTLIPRNEAASRVPTRFHPLAQRYFNPSDNIGYMANVMESLAATKELLFALGAGIYLVWLRWRGLKNKEVQEALSRHKERLDVLLGETLQIEEVQIQTSDVDELRALQDRVTRIKLKALKDFTEEELRGDQTFTVFLTQCANLINNIQLKILTAENSRRLAE